MKRKASQKIDSPRSKRAKARAKRAQEEKSEDEDVEMTSPNQTSTKKDASSSERQRKKPVSSKAASKKSQKKSGPPGSSADTNKIKINRAPVLTLFAAVVSTVEGHDWETSLTVGKAIAVLSVRIGEIASYLAVRAGSRNPKAARWDSWNLPVRCVTFVVM